MTTVAKPAGEGIYRRVSVRMYGDERFARLSPLQPSGQALWLYLLTGPHTTPVPGMFVLGRAALAEILGWDAEAFDKAFAEVIGEGLVEFDAKSRLWLIPKAIQHNMPANPNVVKSWRSTLALMPECGLRDRAFGHIAEALFSLSDAFGKAFAEASGKPSPKTSTKPPRKTSAKQEQEQEQDSSKRTALIPCPYQSIADLYHQQLPDLPKARLMVAARQKLMRDRWGWVLSTTKPDGTRRAETAEDALAWFAEFFARAAENDFIMGRTPRSVEHRNWRCDIDYLLSDRGLKQVIEKTLEAA